MAAIAASAVLSSSAVAPAMRSFDGLRATSSATKVMLPPMKKGGGALGARCDYIGSSTNLIMVGATTLQLIAGRFGLAPTANRKSTAGLKLVDRETGLGTTDPAGFTATDVLAHGAVGHVIGVGVVLGLKALGGQ
eukprot:jgi/Mesen1/8855/ME000053S08265